MIKTLRITSVLTVLLAIAIFVFFVLFGSKSDENIRKLLGSPSVIEQYRNNQGEITPTAQSQISPLLQQAQALALYLNPPKPPPAARQPAARQAQNNVPKTIKQADISPQFYVLGASYYENDPQLSMVYIDETGTGLQPRWVRQSTMVGHLLIEQIYEDYIIVKGETETTRMEVKNNSKSVTTATNSTLGNTSAATTSRNQAQFSTRSQSVGQVKNTASAENTISQSRERENAELLMEELKKINSMEDDQDRAREAMEQIMSSLQSSSLSSEEANKISEIGETLNELILTREPNQ